jgi:hypothetical protein
MWKRIETEWMRRKNFEGLRSKKKLFAKVKAGSGLAGKE